MSRIQKMIFEAVEAAEAGLKHSNVEEIQYRRKESPIPHQKCKNPLDFCSISDRSVPLGVALLPWVSITALASSGAKPRPRGHFSLRWKKIFGIFHFR